MKVRKNKDKAPQIIIHVDQAGNQSGKATISYETEQDAAEAIRLYNNRHYFGQKISMELGQTTKAWAEQQAARAQDCSFELDVQLDGPGTSRGADEGLDDVSKIVASSSGQRQAIPEKKQVCPNLQL